MNSGFLISALACISVLTSLTVEAIKKILDEEEISYSSNLLAVIVSLILTLAVSVGYILFTGIAVSVQVVIIVIALEFLSFLSATCGYDKVVQLIKQIWGKE